MTSTPPSTNQRADLLMGRRATPGVILFSPAERGYQCPRQDEHDPQVTGDLEWSEYNCFLWCQHCNRDYPSALCTQDPERGTEVYLDTMAHAMTDVRARIETILREATEGGGVAGAGAVARLAALAADLDHRTAPITGQRGQ